MNFIIDSIKNSRDACEKIFCKALSNIRGKSEFEIANKIYSETANYPGLYPEGWYSPPPKGIAVLFCKTPYNRLKYESLRAEEFWPQKNIFFETESVGLIYASPVNKQTNMLADLGLTIYLGKNDKIRQHIKKVYKEIQSVAELAQVGMKFSEISKIALKNFTNKYKLTRWITVSSPSDYQINLGHSVPGSFEENFYFGGTFPEIINTIRAKRKNVTDKDDFVIPSSCAFTIESRLEDLNDPDMPSAYFHFIVCFDQGKKTILNNFSKIFKTLGMDYIL